MTPPTSKNKQMAHQNAIPSPFFLITLDIINHLTIFLTPLSNSISKSYCLYFQSKFKVILFSPSAWPAPGLIPHLLSSVVQFLSPALFAWPHQSRCPFSIVPDSTQQAQKSLGPCASLSLESPPFRSSHGWFPWPFGFEDLVSLLTTQELIRSSLPPEASLVIVCLTPISLATEVHEGRECAPFTLQTSASSHTKSRRGAQQMFVG